MTDGGEISSASSALPVAGRLYIGQAVDAGLLSCAFDESKPSSRSSAAE